MTLKAHKGRCSRCGHDHGEALTTPTLKAAEPAQAVGAPAANHSGPFADQTPRWQPEPTTGDPEFSAAWDRADEAFMRKSTAEPAPLVADDEALADLGLGYVHSVLRWAACGYVHTPERLAQLHNAYRIVDRIVNASTPGTAGDDAQAKMLHALQVMDAHYSGSLDHQPAYVSLGRAAIRAAMSADSKGEAR